MRVLRRIFIAFCIGLAWEAGSSADHSLYLLFSRPTSIFAALCRQAGEEGFYEAIGSSTSHVVRGVIIGGSLGTLAGISLTTGGFFRDVIDTLSRLTRPVPPLACVPIGILAFGTSSTTAVFIVAIGVFWTMAIGTEEALKAVPEEIHELARAFGYRRGPACFMKIILPAALPGMFAALRTATGQGWTLVVAAEIAGVPGLGQRMWEASGVLASDLVFTYLAVLTLLNRATDGILSFSDSRLFAWRR